MPKRTPNVPAAQTALFEAPTAAPVFNPAALDAARLAPVIACDTETQTAYSGSGPQTDFGLSYCAPVIVLSLAWSGGDTAIYAPDGNFPPEVVSFLREQFATAQTWVFHNAVFDLRQIGKLTGGALPDVVHDTQVIERLLNPAVDKRYSLIDVAKGYGLATPQEALKKDRAALHTLPIDTLLAYARQDAALTLAIYERQMAALQSEDDYTLYDWECRAVRQYARMAAEGIPLNAAHVQQRILALGARIADYAARLQADGLSKPNSPAERVRYIYDVKNLPKPDPDNPLHEIFFTRTGGLSASGDVLDALREQYPAEAERLRDLTTYLECARMQATLITLLEHAALDGRIHSLVAIATETGRRSSQHPNIQNLKMAVKAADDPAGDMAGVLIAADGCTLVEIDYNGAENWMAALLSGDNNFAAACNAEDFHSAMAAQYFAGIWEKADKDERKRLRRMGKSVTFGTAYGMGPKKLAVTLNIPEQQARQILDAKDLAFPDVAEAKRLAAEKAVNLGYINLWTGRRVPTHRDRSYTAWNYLVQGAVGEMVKRAIVLVSETYQARGLRSRVALDMHDALILEVAHSEWDEALGIASGIMESIIPAELNARTTPPVRWIARPDLADNPKKWGKFQTHPDQTVTDAPAAADVVLPTPEDFSPIDPAAIPLVEVALPDLGFTWKLRCRKAVGFARLTPVERGELRALLVAIWNRVDEAFRQTYTVHLPARTPGGRIVLSQPLTVDLVNYARIPEAWLLAAENGADTQELVGMDVDALKAEIAVRQGKVARLETVMRGVMRSLNTFIEEHIAETQEAAA